jgi:uncharacterized protein (TIGR03437 family)
VLTYLGIYPALAGNQVLLRLLNPSDGTPQAIAADGAGHLFVLSALPGTPGPEVRVVKLDLAGIRLASIDLPQVVSSTAAATDAQGNLIVAGADSSFQGRVVKVDAQLHGPIFSMSLPGAINAMAVDASANVYVTGSTGSTVFPVTGGAFQAKPPGQDPLHGSSAVYAFVTEIASDGSKLLYSTYFGGDATNCTGGNSCAGAYGSTIGTAIAVDSSGGIAIAGTTDATGLPTTPGALGPTCSCQYGVSAGFIAWFQPGAAQQLSSSTFLNAPNQPFEPVLVDALALDAAGNVIVGGNGPATLPTTLPNALGPGGGGFLIKVNRAATAVIWGTFYGSPLFSNVKTVAVDPQGRVLAAGAIPNPGAGLTSSPTSVVASYVARFSADGATLIDSYQGPLGLAGQYLAVTSTGGFASAGLAGGLWIETAALGPSLLAVVNSAGGGSFTTVAPYELISLYGVGIGPTPSLTGQVVNGAYSSSLGGYQVLFDGTPAPLLYAGAGQYNTVVPSGVGGQASTKLQIVTPLGIIDGPSVFVASYEPAVFVNPQTALAAAVNQDGTLNSSANPAAPGTVVTVFATGAGSGPYSDGALVPMGIHYSNVPVYAISGLHSLEVEFAGDAPGMVAGVMQINFRVPDTIDPSPSFNLGFLVGGVLTPSVVIAVAQ